MRPPVASRIAAAREKVGLSANDVAERVGLSVQSYWDLETNDDEAFMAVSLREIVLLSRVLRVSPCDLVDPENSLPPDAKVSYANLVAAIRAQMEVDGVDAEVWGTRVGWDVTGVIADAERVGDLNLDALHDICCALGIDWRAVLPD